EAPPPTPRRSPRAPARRRTQWPCSNASLEQPSQAVSQLFAHFLALLLDTFLQLAALLLYPLLHGLARARPHHRAEVGQDGGLGDGAADPKRQLVTGEAGHQRLGLQPLTVDERRDEIEVERVGQQIHRA